MRLSRKGSLIFIKKHAFYGQELVEQGETIQDYLVRLPGVTYDYAEEIMLIRNGNVTFLLDGIQVDDDVRRMIMPGTEDTWLSQFPNISGGRMWKPCV